MDKKIKYQDGNIKKSWELRIESGDWKEGNYIIIIIIIHRARVKRMCSVIDLKIIMIFLYIKNMSIKEKWYTICSIARTF